MNIPNLAICQFKISENKEDNINKARNKIINAANEGANIVILPECFICPYDIKIFKENSEKIYNPKDLSCLAYNMLIDVSKSNPSVYIFGGSIIEQDINEGCDAVIVKPALSYLDIISKVKDRFNIPIIGYNVSGVYSMVKSASKENLIDEIDVTMEILYSIKRAGATAIITYNAIEIAKKINKK